MSNNYVPDLTPVNPGDLARSADVNDRYDATVAGFDRLPTPKVGEAGFSGACPVGTPTQDDHATTKLWVETAMTSQVNIATTQATNASASAAAALASENNAATSEANAATSESNAATSETNANNSHSYAAEWANKAENLLVSVAAGGDNIDDYSALHHAAKASASAAAALASQNAAALSESNAATSESNAATSESNAATSESNAAASAASIAASAAQIATNTSNIATNTTNITAARNEAVAFAIALG